MVSDSVLNGIVNSIPVLIALILFIGELVIVYKKNWHPDRCIRWTGLTLIILVASYLATLNTLSGTALTAVIGLLGTIAGYLVGSVRTQNEETGGKSKTSGSNEGDKPKPA